MEAAVVLIDSGDIHTSHQGDRPVCRLRSGPALPTRCHPPIPTHRKVSLGIMGYLRRIKRMFLTDWPPHGFIPPPPPESLSRLDTSVVQQHVFRVTFRHSHSQVSLAHAEASSWHLRAAPFTIFNNGKTRNNNLPTHRIPHDLFLRSGRILKMVIIDNERVCESPTCSRSFAAC